MDAVTVKDVMSFELTTTQEQDNLWDTLERMRKQGVRRMPVVNERGGLVGILTTDDVLELISEALQDVSKLIKREQKRESRQRD